MSFVKVWIHFVWSTKNREPMLTESIRSKVFDHIRENGKAKGIFVDFVGGFVDHVHCLVSLGVGQEIEEIVQGLRQDLTEDESRNLFLMRMASRKRPGKDADIDLAA